MHKFLKWLLAIVGLLVLLLVIVAVVLPLTIDPNDYKEEIQQAVKDETGRELTIGGDIGWTVFPWLGFEVNNITLGNRSGFGDEPMLKIGEASAAVKIMPLFNKQVEIGTVTLKDMTVRLSQKANGENNWSDLNESDKQAPKADINRDNTAASVKISGVEIDNANVRWEDAGQVTELSTVNLNISGISGQQPFDLEGGFSVSLTDAALSGDVLFEGKVIPATSSNELQIQGLRLTFKGQQGVVPDVLDVNIEMNTDAAMDESSDTATLSNFSFRLHNMTTAGDLSVTSVSNEPAVKGLLNVAEFNPKTLIKNLGMDTPVTSDSNALTKLSAQMKFSGTSNEANLQGLSLQLDQSAFTGRFRMRNFSSPNLDFELGIDSLNLDDYFPPADKTTNTPAPSGPASAGGTGNSSASDADLSAEVFRGYTGGGSFKIGKLVVADLTATNVSTTLSADNKGWRFYPTVADFYGGKNRSDIRIDATGERPVLTISEDLSGVQADGLLKDLTGEASRLLGTGSLKLNLRTDMSNSASLRNTLSGDLSLNMLDGAFVGIDVADIITQARSLLGKEDETTESLDDQAKTEFAQMGLSGLINNGILTSDDFAMSSTLLKATGNGQINLVNETINYLVKPVLSENVRGEGKSVRGQLSGIPIPIRISGSLYEPKVSVDLVAAVTESQKAKINEKTNELTNKLFDKLLGTQEDKTTDKQAGDGESNAEGAAVEDQKDGTTNDSQQDPADALLNSLFSSKKDKKKKKKAAQDVSEDPETEPEPDPDPDS
jgi:AsmA protein